jgi:uncharacterized membrane protein
MRITRIRFAVALGAGVLAALGFSLSLPASLALLLGWVVTTAVYLAWIWLTVRARGAEETAEHAAAIDPDRLTTDWLLVVSAVASLVAVGFVLVRATTQQGPGEYAQVGLALLSVVLSWAMVHTVFMLRYARLYYAGDDHHPCITFGGQEKPTYADFAYFSFVIGMTYQVSDTTLNGTVIRRTVLRHSLLAYLFGTGIVASAVSLVSSLASG